LAVIVFTSISMKHSGMNNKKYMQRLAQIFSESERLTPFWYCRFLDFSFIHDARISKLTKELDGLE